MGIFCSAINVDCCLLLIREKLEKMKVSKDKNAKQLVADLQMRNRAILLALVDIAILILCYFTALYTRFDFNFNSIPEKYIHGYATMIIPLAFSYVFVFYFFRLYHSIWKFASVVELQRIVTAMFFCWIPNILFILFWFQPMPRSYWAFGWFLSGAGVTLDRFAYRFVRMWKRYNYKNADKGNEIYMVVGGGSAGRTLINEILISSHLTGRVACVIDDDRNKWGRYLDGIQVVGGRNEIPEAVEAYGVTTIIYAIPTAKPNDKKAILRICNETGCKVQTVPGVYELVDGKVSISTLRSVAIEDLLGRDQVIVDNDEINTSLHDKVVLVTGGGGSIGSELCRQIAHTYPKKLVIFDIYENNAYEIEQELKRHMPDLNLVTLIGSVRNTNRINYVMETYKPDVVFHAAAHKHVPLMEGSPNEAIKNNVIGTYKTAEAAAKNGVKKFILISTDKAVNPTNIMGASKRMCEMVVQMCDRKYPNTSYAAVRFGNVLGSNGSVIPLFKKQIEEGGPVTVTDPNMTRFFMTIPEAVALVLQAGMYARGGEIFVLDMGEPVKIDDMARNLIRLSGHEPGVDIDIVYTGLRPGEKMYEEILMDEEGLQSTANNLIHIGKPIDMDDEIFIHQLKRLDEASKNETIDIKSIVKEVVPTYHAS